MRKLTLFLVLGIFAMGAGTADAVELLTNENLETINIPPGWTLSETVTGMASGVNSAELVNFANLPALGAGQTGIFLKAFAGNLDPHFLGQNKKINAVLSQTVPHTGVANEMYTFTGWSKWEPNYSGAADTLDDLSPSGAVPSPTESTFVLAFLDAGNSVLGSPVTFDLRTPVAMGGQIGDNTPRQHTLMGAAPVGTANVRVTASATDMVFNVDPQQAGFYDNFSLKAASAPATETLTNGGLNEPAITPGWTLIKSPANATQGIFNVEGFANNTPGGLGGLWLRAFIGGDAKITQTVPGTAGANYEFSGWAKLQPEYSGLDPASSTETFMTMEFLDGSSALIGAPVSLDLRDFTWDPGVEEQGVWQELSLNGAAPAGTASIRVTAGATGMFDTMPMPSAPQSAFFDDLSLMLAAASVPGDYNGNGTVDAADYVLWREAQATGATTLDNRNPSLSGPVDAQDYNYWRERFGNTAPGAASGVAVAAAAIPEPSGYLLAVTSVVFATLGIGRFGRGQ